jgi:pilus assembly protein Flp/PilA
VRYSADPDPSATRPGRRISSAVLCPTFPERFYQLFIGQVYHLHMIALIRKFCADERGATAIEYGLIAAGIALAIIATVNGLGSKLNTKFTSINSSLK